MFVTSSVTLKPMKSLMQHILPQKVHEFLQRREGLKLNVNISQHVGAIKSSHSTASRCLIIWKQHGRIHTCRVLGLLWKLQRKRNSNKPKKIHCILFWPKIADLRTFLVWIRPKKHVKSPNKPEWQLGGINISFTGNNILFCVLYTFNVMTSLLFTNFFFTSHF